jgi:hypothetical protein
MTRWMGGTLAIAATVVCLSSTSSVIASEPGIPRLQSASVEVSAHRHYSRLAPNIYRPYYPYYYGRPYYYSPGPFFLPVPPSWGYGW